MREFQYLFEEFCGYLTHAHRVTAHDINLATRVNSTIDQLSALVTRDYSKFKVPIQDGISGPFISIAEYYSSLEALTRRLRYEYPFQTVMSPAIPPPPSTPSPMVSISNNNETNLQFTQQLDTYIAQQLAQPIPQKQKDFLSALGEKAKSAKDIGSLVGVITKLAMDHQVELHELAKYFPTLFK